MAHYYMPFTNDDQLECYSFINSITPVLLILSFILGVFVFKRKDHPNTENKFEELKDDEFFFTNDSKDMITISNPLPN